MCNYKKNVYFSAFNGAFIEGVNEKVAKHNKMQRI